MNLKAKKEVCPHCKIAEIDDNRLPLQEDIALCERCGATLIYDKNKWRLMTPVDFLKLVSEEPETLMKLATAQAAILHKNELRRN